MNDTAKHHSHSRRAWRGGRVARRVQLIGAALLSAFVALMNPTITAAVFPALTLLDSPVTSVAVALGAGMLLPAAWRFPLSVLVIESAVGVITAVIPSLAVSALVAGTRCGVTSWRSIAATVAAVLAITTAPWMPPGGRVLGPLIVLLPWIVGSLIHASVQHRQTNEERLRLLTANVALLKEQASRRERERIADELHDQLGHHLTAIEIQARLLQDEATDMTSVVRRAELIQSQADLALRGVHLIVRPGSRVTAAESTTSQEERGTCTIQHRMQELADVLDVVVDCSIGNGLNSLPFNIEYVLLRVVQEGLTNAARHAAGELVRLRMFASGSRVSLRLENRVAAGPSGQGRGLASLRRQLESVQGTLLIQSDRGSGLFVLECSVVVPAEGAPG